MKKIIALILVAVSVLAFCSCNKTPDTIPTATPTTTPGTTGSTTPVKFALDITSYVLFSREKLVITPSVSEGTTWKSSDESVVTVSDKGLLSALKKGSAEITATSAKGETAICKIKVVDANDFFVPADIASLSLKKSELDKGVQDELKLMCEYFSTLVETDRAAAKGDTVRATYVGVFKGETAAFDGGSGTNDIEIGSGTFIPGFEDGLIGAKKDEVVTLNLTFPEDYIDPAKDAAAAERFNGKEVTFTVTVHSVRERKPAELNDELVVKATNSTYKTVAEYTEYVRNSLENYMKIEVAIKASQIKGYDEDALSHYKSIYISNTYGTYASMYGMSVEDFVKQYYGLSAEDLNKEAEESAKGYLEQLYLCYTLNLTPTEEEKKAILTEYLSSNGYTGTIEEFTKAYGEAFVYNYVITEYALDYVEKTVKLDEAN